MVKLTIQRDYNGFFERLVREWAKDVKEFKHKEIVISAMPYLPDAVQFRSENGVLYLTFYSAMHAGFGHLSKSEVEELKAIF